MRMKDFISRHVYVVFAVLTMGFAFGCGTAVWRDGVELATSYAVSATLCAYLTWMHYSYMVSWWDDDGDGEPLPIPDDHIWDADDVLRNHRDGNIRSIRRTGT